MTTFTRQAVPDITATHEGLMRALWTSGYDTFEIARKLDLKEFQVYNHLSQSGRVPR